MEKLTGKRKHTVKNDYTHNTATMLGRNPGHTERPRVVTPISSTRYVNE